MSGENEKYTVIETGFHVESRDNGIKKLIGYCEIGQNIYYPTDQETPIYTVFATEAEAVADVNEHEAWEHPELPHRIKLPALLTLENLNVDPETLINSGGYYEKIQAFKENNRPFYKMYNGAWLVVYAADVFPEDLLILENDNRVIYEPRPNT